MESKDIFSEKKIETFTPSSSGLQEINMTHSSNSHIFSMQAQYPINVQHPQYLSNMQYRHHGPIINVNNYTNYYMSSQQPILGTTPSNNNLQTSNQINCFYSQPQNYRIRSNNQIQSTTNYDIYLNRQPRPSSTSKLLYPELAQHNNHQNLYSTLPLSAAPRNIPFQPSYRSDNLSRLRYQQPNTIISNYANNINLSKSNKKNK